MGQVFYQEGLANTSQSQRHEIVLAVGHLSTFTVLGRFMGHRAGAVSHGGF